MMDKFTLHSMTRDLSAGAALVAGIATINTDISLTTKVSISCGVALIVWVVTKLVLARYSSKVAELIEEDLDQEVEENEYVPSYSFDAAPIQQIAIKE